MPMFSWPMMTGAFEGGVLYSFTTVPQIPATSNFIKALSSGICGIGNSRISVLPGPTRTAARTFSIEWFPPTRARIHHEREEMERVTIAGLQQMKRDGRKIVAVVAWDFQIAQIADRAGVDVVSVGDSVGVNLWGHTSPLEITLEEMIVVCKAVRRGTKRAIVSCDFPGPLPGAIESAVQAVVRLVKEGGADMVKIDGAADFPEAVTAIVRAGIPVFGQFGIASATPLMTEKFVADAMRLEAAGASLLGFFHSR